MDAVPPERPIRLVVHDDLRRNRLTVFFRLLLALPHLVWLLLWGFAAAFVSFILWLTVLIDSRAPEGLHDFLAGFDGRGGMGAPEAVPLALVVAFAFQLATAPASVWISRRMEAEADWKALEVTRNPEALEGVMVGFTETSLHDPDPPGWVQFMLGTHPALEDRVAMARAWAERRP